MNIRLLAPLLLALLSASAALASPMSERDVPEPLKAWIPWVLHDQQASLCPTEPNNVNLRLCTWPSQLQLDLDADGGRFEMRATTLAPGWFALPGDGPRWPQDVSLNGRAAPVLEWQNLPALWLDAGEHRVQGRFSWKALPESLRVPPGSGLIALNVSGRSVPHPQRDAQQQLWLGRRAVVADAQEERLSLRVFRLIEDEIPLTVTTQIQVEVGGEVREEVIGPALLAGLVPLSLSGDLPARLEDDGRLRVQLRPGLWTLTLVARSTAPVSVLMAPPAAEHWAVQEVWSLSARHHLRVIEASGLPATDPRQVGVPENWQSFPAFVTEPGAALKLTETQRGSSDLAPDALNLTRHLWLDFDGDGFTVQDQLLGQLSRTWRMEAQAPITLGRVQVDGQPQLITQHGAGTGVEVRHGTLNLVADSRIEDGARRLPAGGWSTDLQGIQTTLHLPPAWRLLAAPGVDNVPDTWLSRWTLLDLFLVLIAAIAALRVFGRGVAALTLFTLALTWHEPGAPQWTWLNLIAAIALLRALPKSFDDSGRLHKLLFGYQWIAAGVLAFVALPFAVQQARLSLYPQLENEYGFAQAGFDMRGGAFEGKDMAQAEMEASMERMESQELARAPTAPAAVEDRAYDSRVRRALSKSAAYANSVSQSSIQKLDPNVLTQTGPGLPGWSWRESTLSWSGPVTADQDFTLWLMPPILTRALGWLSILLILLLAARWLAVPLRMPSLKASAKAASLLAGLITIGVVTALAAPVHAQDPSAGFIAPPQPPSADILRELRERLTAPADCQPNCASWSRMSLSVSGGDRLMLRLTAEAQVDTVLRLPVPPLSAGQNRVWQPQTVLLDDRDAALVRDNAGALWLRVPQGRHSVVVSGELAGFAQLQLPMSPAPRMAEFDTPGWLLTGIDTQGRPGSAVELIRERKEETSTSAEGSTQALPPLLRLTRTLQLGLVWGVESSLTREGNAQGAYVATLPALAGEVVTGDSVRVVNGKIQASFAPNQDRVSWTSRLDTTNTLALKAGDAPDLIETWRFDVSPLWHIGFSGIPAVTHQENDWRLVTFRPWPGESVTAQIARPEAVKGQVLTLDLAELTTQPGKRATDYTLSLSLRASQGGQHALPLPAGLELQGLEIDGAALPARRENDRVILPLHPGQQNIVLKLRADEGLGLLTSTPALQTAIPGVNARLGVQLPQDRWVLFAGGPALGPAVLFWGVLVVMLVVALGLGRLGMTPLKGMQWALLMVGLSQLPISGAALVAGWLFALALRSKIPQSWSARRFNVMQILLALWTLLALSTLFGAVAQGLLGTPDMQIGGNGSSAFDLRWYQDRFDGTLPSAWVLSVSIWFYRGLMLLWALWLANSLLNWLRWGWSQYSSGGLWKKSPLVARVAPTKAAAPDTGEIS